MKKQLKNYIVLTETGFIKNNEREKPQSEPFKHYIKNQYFEHIAFSYSYGNLDEKATLIPKNRLK